VRELTPNSRSNGFGCHYLLFLFAEISVLGYTSNHLNKFSPPFPHLPAKGASVLRMIARYIGMDAFFEGMKLYLTRHAYGNTVTNDLWRALEEVSGKPVVKFMEAWTLKVGYPIIELSGDGNIKIERYLAAGPEEGSETTQWSIPVTAIVEGSNEVQGPWVIQGPDGDETEVIKAKIKEWTEASKWFKLNADQTGFFRVAYTKEQAVRLSEVMKPGIDSGLTTVDRLGLISDSFAAGRAGYCSIQESLALIEHFGEHETAGKYSIVLDCSFQVILSETLHILMHDFSLRIRCMAGAVGKSFRFGVSVSFRVFLSQVSNLSAEPLLASDGNPGMERKRRRRIANRHSPIDRDQHAWCCPRSGCAQGSV